MVLFTTACGQSTEEIAQAVAETRAAEPSPTAVLVTVIHTAIAEVPVTVEVTKQIEVTRIVELPVTVTFTATPGNGGPTPTYIWYVNASIVGSNSPTYTTSTLANGDIVTC
ncbi:MAG: hypothetical protein ACK2U5_06065, partial [Candidatus Promineifilaceae bacterium]